MWLVILTMIGALGSGVFGASLLKLAVEEWRVVLRFRRDGRLLYGRLLRAKYSGEAEADYCIHVDVTFTDPDGCSVRGIAQSLRTDLICHRIPQPGTPIAVLYADSGQYELL